MAERETELRVGTWIVVIDKALFRIGNTRLEPVVELNGYRAVPPHPGPLPWGEGELSRAF